MSATVLVVDDDRDLRILLEAFLGAEGFTVLTACDGRDALRRLQTCTPSIILLDLMMPGMDGAAFRSVQQNEPNLRQIPTLCLSARHDASTVAARLGCRECLMKPLDLDKLVAAIRRHNSHDASSSVQQRPASDTRLTKPAAPGPSP